MRQTLLTITLFEIFLGLGGARLAYAEETDLTGRWRGNVAPVYSVSGDGACDAAVRLTQTETTLVVEEATLRCAGFGQALPRAQSRIQPDDVTFLVHYGNLNLHFYFPNREAVTFVIHGRTCDGHAVYHEGLLTR